MNLRSSKVPRKTASLKATQRIKGLPYFILIVIFSNSVRTEVRSDKSIPHAIAISVEVPTLGYCSSMKQDNVRKEGVKIYSKTLIHFELAVCKIMLIVCTRALLKFSLRLAKDNVGGCKLT